MFHVLQFIQTAIDRLDQGQMNSIHQYITHDYSNYVELK